MIPIPTFHEDRRPGQPWRRATLLARFIGGVVWVLLLGLAWAPAAVRAEAPALRIAVAPFSGERAESQVAVSLAKQLDGYALERLIAPGAFVADAQFEPTAGEVRRWAYNAAVETVIVGRVVVEPLVISSGEAPSLERRIEVIVRSGHSGAEVARHTAELPVGASGMDAATGALAIAILDGLGYEAPPPEIAQHEVGLGTRPDALVSNQDSSGEAAGRGLEGSLGLPGFKNDAPIEIKADEAEIMNRGSHRTLIFQHNVLVRQSNVVLRSDRLEASYRKGESEPDRLDARGKVFVDQAGRSAKCDHAIYLRDAQKLTCSGHAELVQGCDVVRGDSIQFDLAADRARVEGAASIVIRPDSEAGALCAPVGGVL